MPGTAFPRAAGKVNIGSAAMRYIPALYSGKMLKKYYDSAVVPAISNTDYEGEIKKFGDTVYIRGIPDITIRDYVKGQTLVNEQPEATSTELLIDKGKYWSFVSDDVDKVQADIKGYVQKWAADGAEQMRIAVDTDVLGGAWINVPTANRGATAGVRSSAYNLGVSAAAAGSSGTPLELTKANILDTIVDCGSVLDEQNVSDEGRFLVLPIRLINLIKKSDIKDVSMTGDGTSAIRSGLIGQIDRFVVYASNLLSYETTGSDNAWRCLFGHKEALTFATQLTETKAQDNPDGFGMLHRGLVVYGYKLVNTPAMGVLYAQAG